MMKIKRPNRYPYTRRQWEEEITVFHTSNNDCFKLRVLKNQITGERVQHETFYRNLDPAICWIEYLAVEQDCRTRSKASDCRL